MARLGGGARVELVHNAVSSSHEMVARAGGEQGNPGSNKVSSEHGVTPLFTVRFYDIL